MAKEMEQVSDTHVLKKAEEESSQNGERNKISGALTNWRGQREGQVTMAKETVRAGSTNQLEGVEGGSSHDGKRNGAGKKYSPTGGGRGKVKL
jgi:hypothetical protein